MDRPPKPTLVIENITCRCGGTITFDRDRRSAVHTKPPCKDFDRLTRGLLAANPKRKPVEG